jgi:hypothetical protein
LNRSIYSISISASYSSAACAQNLTAHVGADHKRGMQSMWPQIIIAAEAQQRARNDALAMLLTGQARGQSQSPSQCDYLIHMSHPTRKKSKTV